MTDNAREIPLPDISPDDEARWRELAANAAEPNPFFEPDFVLAAHRTLREPASLLVVERDGDWQGCLPVQRARVSRAVPALRTWNHIYCFLGTPLVVADGATAATRDLLSGAVRAAPGSRVSLELLCDDGPIGAAVHEAAGQLGLRTLMSATTERAFLRRRPAGDYLAGLRSHRRRELNRLGRRLAAELGGELEVSERAGDEAAVDTFLELERSGWKGRAETAFASMPEHERLFREICHTFAAAGRLQLLALSVDDRTVAMKCNLTAGNGAFCFKIAYDEDLAAFSPGVQLERENVTVFHERDTENWQDSCADPDNAMINRLWPDRRQLSNLLLGTKGVRTAVVGRGLRTAHGIRARRGATPSAPS